MAVDEELSRTFRDALEGLPGTSDKKMMGGTCFFVNGHMVGGAHREKDGRGLFMFRVGVDNVTEAEAIGGGEKLVQGGRVMRGFYFVLADDCQPDLFEAWKSLAVAHALSLPPKEAKPERKGRPSSSATGSGSDVVGES